MGKFCISKLSAARGQSDWEMAVSSFCLPNLSEILVVLVQSLSPVGLLQPNRLQPARLLCPWDSPGRSPAQQADSLLTEQESLFTLIIPFDCTSKDAVSAFPEYLQRAGSKTTTPPIPKARDVQGPPLRRCSLHPALGLLVVSSLHPEPQLQKYCEDLDDNFPNPPK